MGNNTHQLEIRSIDQLKGCFRIPSYQRGYRWERRQVEQLLEDLLEHSESMERNKPYYLQPIVVAPVAKDELNRLKKDERFDYDLIDGQQRLTTIFLILKALQAAQTINKAYAQELMSKDMDNALAYMGLSHTLKGVNTTIGYELMYQTRKDSRDFINNITTVNRGDDRIRSTPDHLYLWHAYNIITKWINTHPGDVKAIAEEINYNVRIIWYELSESVPNWKKFKDLNDGKIPLTNSELIKALVLRRQNKQDLPDYEQDVIVSQWDEIEQDLSDEKFWRFLTKKSMKDYPTKIDLIFDLLAGKSPQDKKDEYFTFIYFIELFEKNGKNKENWVYIHDRYRRIRDWYNDTWMYHRIGYLVAVGDDTTLREIYKETYPEKGAPLTHRQLREAIEERIRKSMEFPDVDSFKELTYGTDLSNKQIIRVLTLYNVMLADELSDRGVRYPFHKHNDNGKQGGWSLEHVHAQNSEDLKGLTEWKTWVDDQLESLKRIEPQLQANGTNYTKDRFIALIDLMERFLSANKPDEKQYKDIVTEFAELTSIKGNGNSKFGMHSIANLVLLSKSDNSMLNKSTFDVKRMRIALKSSTNFVPLGTERVFMKAIAGFSKDDKDNPITGTKYACDTSQMFFWGDQDREAYIRDIEEKLGKYLIKDILAESNDNDTTNQ